MSIIVKKFGGTSVESIEKIKRIADHLAFEKEKGDDIVVVVSAMGKTTDALFKLAYEIIEHPDQREMDMLLTAGERITMALLSISLQKLNIKSISFTGSQSGIITDNSHGNAKILTVNAFRILEELKKGKIVIVAGFQGVSVQKEITTLGRGGSDTTAVAIASYLNAHKCEIFTDVDGVFQLDPNRFDNAKKIDKLCYEEMLFLAYSGAKVLHSRAAEFAYKYKIPLEVKNSNSVETRDNMSINNEGTMINDFNENSEIKAVSIKDNILIYDITIPENNLPLFSTEIYDIEIISPYFAKAYISANNKQQFILEMKNNNIDYTSNEALYTVINLLGYRIHKDIAFINLLYKKLKEICKDTFSIKNQGIGIQICVTNVDSENVTKNINQIME